MLCTPYSVECDSSRHQLVLLPVYAITLNAANSLCIEWTVAGMNCHLDNLCTLGAPSSCDRQHEWWPDLSCCKQEAQVLGLCTGCLRPSTVLCIYFTCSLCQCASVVYHNYMHVRVYMSQGKCVHGEWPITEHWHGNVHTVCAVCGIHVSQCSLTVQTCQGLLYNWFVKCLERRYTHKLGTQDTHTQYYNKLLILADHSNATHAHNVPHSSHAVLATLVTQPTPNSPLMRDSAAVLVRPTLSVGAETTQVVPLHWGLPPLYSCVQ